MAALLLLGYAAICVLVFKILRVPVNKWTVTTASIGGVVLVGGLLLAMNYNHPFTTDARLYFYTTPIVPEVKGRVVEVAVNPNVPLKRGDPLFKLDPRPYQFVVEQKKAALAEAEQNVKELKASLDQASAAVTNRGYLPRLIGQCRLAAPGSWGDGDCCLVAFGSCERSNTAERPLVKAPKNADAR
jgi:multidrug resistance efflux pump